MGSIVAPESKFYLVAGDQQGLETAMRKSASIGYEANIAGAFGDTRNLENMTNEKEEQECLPLILVSQINTIWTKMRGLKCCFC